MSEHRRKTDPMTVEAGQRVFEAGRQRGLELAELVLIKHFGNDYGGVAALAELRKLKEKP